MAEKVDQYAQVAYMHHQVPIAGTLSWTLLQIAQFALDAPKLGLKIARVEFDIYEWIANCLSHAGAASIDTLTVGLSISNLVAAITQDRPEVVYAASRTCYFGTNVGVNFSVDPIIRVDFTTFPGGGILIPADKLYLGGSSDNVGTATDITARMWYTVVPLTAESYLELIEQRTILST